MLLLSQAVYVPPMAYHQPHYTQPQQQQYGQQHAPAPQWVMHGGGAQRYGQPRPPPPPPVHEYQQTQTIKNQVNLRKPTLRLSPVGSNDSSADARDATEFALSFGFDASSPCRISTFLLATEDPRQGCRVIAAAPQLRPPAYYGRGVRHLPNTVWVPACARLGPVSLVGCCLVMHINQAFVG
jgi:E3 ubiquitin-protein ligase MGRN1